MRIAAIALLLVAGTAEAGDCVPAGAATTDARITEDAAIACYKPPDAAGDAACWRFDFAPADWSRTPAPAPPPVVVAAPAGKRSFATVIHVCAPACHDLTLPGVSELGDGDVVENADRSLIAVAGPAGAPGNQPLYVFDAATGALRATLHAWNAGMGAPATLQQVRFMGKLLYVSVSSTPVTFAGRLYDPRTGRKVTDVGAPVLAPTDDAITDLGHDRYAFRTLDTDEIYLYDTAAGKQLPSVITGAKDFDYPTLRVIDAGRPTLVGVGTTAAAGVIHHALATHKTSREVAPSCK